MSDDGAAALRTAGAPDDPAATDDAHLEAEHRARPATSVLRSDFFRWSAGMVLAVIVALVAASLHLADGHFVYLLDDTAIHMSVARNLAEHGTWGVTPGVYESASSSPLWTLLIAGTTLVLPIGDEFAPLLLSTLAVIGALAVLARTQNLLRPSIRRPLDVAATAVLAVLVLYLPVFGVMGMEHALHIALLLAALHLVTRLDLDEASPRTLALLGGVLGLASLVRFETLFVALGIGVGLLATATSAFSPTHERRSPARQMRRAVFAGLTVGAPIACYGIFNLMMGQEFFPNSVVRKSALNGAGLVPSPIDMWQALSRDPAVLVLLVICVAYLAHAAAGGARRAALPAVTFLVAVVLHSAYADYGWFDRYQGYLIALGVYAALQMATEFRLEGSARRVALVTIVLVGVLVTPAKAQLLFTTPYASDNTYSERYQVGRFFQRYYRHRPVATGELGYASLLHDGPIVDWFGLGDHEVLEQVLAGDGQVPVGYWKRRLKRDRVEVIVNYSAAMGLTTPKEWTLVGEWRLRQPLQYQRGEDLHLQFWAPAPRFVEPLRRNFEDFTPRLPAGVEATCWACLQGLHPG